MRPVLFAALLAGCAHASPDARPATSVTLTIPLPAQPNGAPGDTLVLKPTACDAEGRCSFAAEWRTYGWCDVAFVLDGLATCLAGDGQ